jgi:hypothetical protein
MHFPKVEVFSLPFLEVFQSPLTPINSNTEASTISRIMLSYIGYLMLSLLRMKLAEDTSLEKCLSILGEVREVVYKDGSLDLPELTKPQKEIMKMVGLL